MFGLGIGEILLILVVALLVFGPTKLPDLARTMGKAMAEFRKASRDLRDTFETEFYKMEHEQPPAPKREPRLIEADLEEPRPARPPEGTVPSAPAQQAPAGAMPQTSPGPVPQAPAGAPPPPAADPASSGTGLVDPPPAEPHA